MPAQLSFADIQKAYPSQWVLVGNPIMDESEQDVVSGIPILGSVDKKEVLYLGKEPAKAYDMITVVFTGTLPQHRVLTGIFNRV